MPMAATPLISAIGSKVATVHTWLEITRLVARLVRTPSMTPTLITRNALPSTERNTCPRSAPNAIRHLATTRDQTTRAVVQANRTTSARRNTAATAKLHDPFWSGRVIYAICCAALGTEFRRPDPTGGLAQ